MKPFRKTQNCQVFCFFFTIVWSMTGGQQSGATEAPDPSRNEYGINTTVGIESYLCTKAEDQPISNDFFINLPEDTEVNSVIKHLQINGNNNQVDISVAKPDTHITFDKTSRNLSLVKPVSREDVTTINMKLSCTILATTQTLEMQVILMVIDVNDNPPEFNNPELSIDISELTPVGTTVVRDLVATDNDVDNWYITYEIDQTQPYTDYFAIPIPARGEIVLQRQLDYETLQSINLRVLAKDNHLPTDEVPNPEQLTSTATVTINIIDGDDLNPAFINAPYLASINENERVGAVINVVPPIQAMDQDVNIASKIIYSLEMGSSDAQDYFSINPDTAELTLANSAISRGNRYTLLVKATQADNSDRYATALVDIYATAANENAPAFLQKHYIVDVVENTPVNSLIITVSAIDNDEDFQHGSPFNLGTSTMSVPSEGTVLRYSFTNPDDAKSFKIDTYGGEIWTNSSLDFEAKTQYNISLSVTDGLFTDDSLLTVNIVDLNDNSPQFTQLSYTFTAKRETDFVVGQVKATDRDQNSSVQYFVKNNLQLFSIDKSGVISIEGDSDQLQYNEFTLLVSAIDSGSPSLESYVPVYIGFEPKLNLVGASKSEGDSDVDTVILIVLGIICGLLLVIIILLLIYIYRNSTNRQSPQVPGFVKSQSFESRLNYERPVPSYLDDPEGLTFKPRARHLAIYNNVDAKENPPGQGTSMQDSPFLPEEVPYQVTAYENSRQHSDFNDNTDKQYSSLSSMPSMLAPDHKRQMFAVNEIEYETAIAPMDDLSYGNDSSSANGSLPSSINSVNGAFSTFRSSGSTQHLVTPGATPKGTINKRPSVSFIDSQDVNMYNPQGSPVNPKLRNMPIPIGEDDKPGITLYY